MRYAISFTADKLLLLEKQCSMSVRQEKREKKKRLKDSEKRRKYEGEKELENCKNIYIKGINKGGKMHEE